MKPYRVDFKYVVEETASMFVVAPDPDAAAEGAKEMLSFEDQYTSPEITSVEEYKREPKPTVN
jgi:hypothetical protein